MAKGARGEVGRRPFDAAVAQQLARIAQVPAKNQVVFSEHIQAQLDVDWERYRKGIVDYEQLIRVQRAASELIDALRALDHQSTALLEVLSEAALWGINPPPTAEAMAAAIAHAASGAGSIQPPKIAGRPTRDAGQDPFGTFVWNVLSIVDKAGGELTLDKNRGSKPGSLVEFLDIIRLLLPAWLFPEPLPLSTLQRIKTNWTRNRARKI